MIPQELIERARKIGISQKILEKINKNGYEPKHYVEVRELVAKKIPLTREQELYRSELSWVTKSTIKTTLIGNGFEIECHKLIGTDLADYLVLKKIYVSEIRFPFNQCIALIYGKQNPEVDIEEVVNQYSKKHGY